MCEEPTEDEEEELSEEALSHFAVCCGLMAMALTFSIGYVVDNVLKITLLPEAAVAVLVGMAFSGVFWVVQGRAEVDITDMERFDKEFFFVWLLPPIIFEAGYNMRAREFFTNIGATALYAFIGTFVSTLMVGGIVFYAGQQGWCHSLSLLPSLVFGALISATDPVTVLAVFQSLGVNVNLFSMVFGESVLNDAVAIVLYRTLMQFKCTEVSTESMVGAIMLFCQIFFFSFVIGVVMGLLSALTFLGLDKLGLQSHQGHHFMEACLSATFPWVAYFLAEALELSGIVAILFAGITMANYTIENMSEKAQSMTREMFKVAAMFAETFVFIYLGMAIFSFQEAGKLIMLEDVKIRLIAIAIGACLFARLFNIIPCSLLINCFRKEQPEPGTVGKVSWVYMFIMWFSGLRGGVAFAIAATNYADNEFPENDESLAILQTTLWVATFTIFVFGGLITNIAIYFDVLDKPGDAAKEVEMTTSLSESRKNQFKAMDSFYDMDRSMKKYTSFSAQGRLEGSHAHSRLEEE